MDFKSAQDLVRRYRAATERMGEIGQGIGGLAVAHPEMADDWSTYQTAVTVDSDEPSLPEQLLAALSDMVPREQALQQMRDDQERQERLIGIAERLRRERDSARDERDALLDQQHALPHNDYCATGLVDVPFLDGIPQPCNCWKSVDLATLRDRASQGRTT